MEEQFFVAEQNHIGLKLDPRTKLVLLLAVILGVFLNTSGPYAKYVFPVMCAVPFLLMLSAAKYKRALQYLCCFLLFFALQKLVMGHTTGLLNAFIALNCYIVLRFTPTAVMGYYVMSTTTVSEFMAAMGRMHITDKITIPIAVMFRFFPTVIEEIQAINDSMKMRGVSLGGGKLSELLEYRIVPILMCSARIGEELSQAALTRGLGGNVRRTNICEIGFRFVDFILIAVGMAAIILMQIQ